MWMLRAADLFFVVFHTAFVLLSITGFLFPRLRKANLVALLLTALSWFGLGLRYGLGFCPLTEWHWQVLRAMGERRLPRSYIQYLFQRVLGLSLPAESVDILVAVAFGLSLILSVSLNLRDHRQRKKLRQNDDRRVSDHHTPAPQ